MNPRNDSTDALLAQFGEQLEQAATQTHMGLATYFDSHPDHIWTGAEVAAEIRALDEHVKTARLIERATDPRA